MKKKVILKVDLADHESFPYLPGYKPVYLYHPEEPRTDPNEFGKIPTGTIDFILVVEVGKK